MKESPLNPPKNFKRVIFKVFLVLCDKTLKFVIYLIFNMFRYRETTRRPDLQALP